MAVVGIALILLLGALITPWGLARSHGSAAMALPDHSQRSITDDGHGHSHGDDAPAPVDSHAHHATDHSHDSAHALPLGLPGSGVAGGVWRQHSANAGPWPSLDGLERPPRT